MAKMMKAAVFVEPGRIVLDEKPVPDVGSGQASVRVTTTTICDTADHDCQSGLSPEMNSA